MEVFDAKQYGLGTETEVGVKVMREEETTDV
jgi:hypothetical protein